MADSEHTTVEEWRTVVGFPEYEVSNLGHVRSYKLGVRRPLKRFVNGKYYKVNLLAPGGEYRKLQAVHHLVLEAFVGPRPDDMECCHNNGRHLDNRLENLRWDTRKANMEDVFIHGKRKHAEEQPRKPRHPLFQPKLSAEQVKEIRAKWVPHKYSFARLAKDYGVCLRTIERIIYRQRRADIA